MASPSLPIQDGKDTARNEAWHALLRRLLVRLLSVVGMASLVYVLGAAVMFFELPSATFLRRAFVGGMAWYETRNGEPSLEQPGAGPIGRIDQPEKTCDGFTLYMGYQNFSKALLVNMLGHVVHQWHVPYSQVWPDPTHVRGPVDDASIYFSDGYIYPNGDFLVLMEAPVDQRNASTGYGLAKLDKDSKVLWKYAENCHHDIDVGEDGTIYAIVNETVRTVPPGLERIPTPCMVDVLHVISPEGKKLKTIPLLEAIKNSPYSPLLGIFEPGTPRDPSGAPSSGQLSLFDADTRNRDVLHTNAVRVLNHSLAPKFPLFKAGQLLISLRNLDALAVVDPDSGKVIWAVRGPWRAQHDPSFLENGHLLLFDNLGSPRGSRVLEYDPQTQAFPWSYPGENAKPFFSRIRGMCQRLPNGNTLIGNSDGGEVFEVTPAQEEVWSCSSKPIELIRARRYTSDRLHFLKGDARARP